MPLGSWAPNFSYVDIANTMQTMIDTLPDLKKAASNYKFKTWKEVCASWLEDVKSEIVSK